MLRPNTFVPFFGVVEDLDDPEELGRIRVRAYGYHTENKQFIPTEFLNWFTPIVSNSAGMSGIGYSPTGLKRGSTVFGYFMDQDYQEGIIVGSLTGKPTHHAFINLGFNDPEGVYPIYTNESDVNRLARGEKTHWIFEKREDARFRGIQGPLSSGEWDEPAYNNQSKYPDNQVFETESGHVKEYDDTKDNERIHEYHCSGTYYEIDAKGNRVVKVVGDGYEIIAGDKNAYVRGTVNLTIDGNCKQYIKGNWDIQVDGSKTEVVLGNVNEYYEEQSVQVKGSQTNNIGNVTTKANDFTVEAGNINLNE